MVESPRCESAHLLRGLAALSVAWFHFTNGQPLFLDEGSFLKNSGGYGYLGVAVFFAISGFVIPYSLDRMQYQISRDALTFIKRRFWRLYPAYVAAIIITIALNFASMHIPNSKASIPDLDGGALIGNLTYSAPWIGTYWLSPIFWSLAIEVQFYVAMVFLAIPLLSRKRLVLFATLAAINCLAFVPTDHTFLFWYLPTFGVGISWYLYYSRRLPLLDATSQALGFVIVAWFTMGTDYALACAFAFGAMTLPIRKIPVSLGFLGTISYSIYLLHSQVGGRVINLATRLPHVLSVQIATLCVAMSATALAAYLLWRIIEQRVGTGPAPTTVDAFQNPGKFRVRS